MKKRILSERQIEGVVKTIASTTLPLSFLEGIKFKTATPFFIINEHSFSFEKNFLYKLRNYESSLRREGEIKERRESILLGINSFCVSHTFFGKDVGKKFFKRILKRIKTIVVKVESTDADG